MTCEQAFFERPTARVQRPEPDPLFSLAERLAAWSHEFGAPATDREWSEALESGLIPFSP